MAEQWDIDDFLSDYRPPEQVVSITIRGDLLGRLLLLEEQLREARSGDDNDSLGTENSGRSAFEIADEIEKTREEVRKSMREFRFASVGDVKWSDLTVKFPPKPDSQLPFDPDKFWPAAIAASAVEPPMTVAQAEKLMEKLSSGQTRKMIDAVMTVNGGDDDLPKSASASVLRRHSKQKPTTAVPGESPVPSS